MATITCRECGQQRSNTPSNTLYCRLCRILIDLDHWRVKTRCCASQGCSAVFAPLNRADRHCSACNPGLRQYSGPCGYKSASVPAHEGRRVEPALPVCADCVRDPKVRRTLIAALERGQQDRRRANNHKEES